MALADGRTPYRTLQVIASFWLGKASYEKGDASALLGLATHFGLATIMAAGYFAIALAVGFFRRRIVTAGLVYGIFLYFVMYYAVLPWRWPQPYPRFDGLRSGLDVLAHIGVGIAIAFVIAQAMRRR